MDVLNIKNDDDDDDDGDNDDVKDFVKQNAKYHHSSKRIGWIPLKEELKEETRLDFGLIFGLSMTEMEIMHAAYRQDNPNGKLTGIKVAQVCIHFS